MSFRFDIRVVKSRAVPGTTEGGAQIILDVYHRAPQRPSDAAMGGFSRRISQSGKPPTPPPSFSELKDLLAKYGKK
jgi:hypothetical protein